jgi:hypothetical protein
MSEQPDPQPSANGHIPRKRQARLDDNGEPAGLPALKKMKSVENNGSKKKLPAKTSPENNNSTPAPLKKTHSVDTDVTIKSNTTSPPETVIVVSDDDDDISAVPEAPEEDAEAQLGK